MRLKLARACWWLGALLAVFPLVCAVSALLSDHEVSDLVAGVFAGVAVALIATGWAAAFALGGSFWKPPALRAGH